MQKLSTKPAKKPKPRKMIIAILLASFLGGPCTFQRIVSVENEIPSKDKIFESLNNQAKTINSSVQSNDVKEFAQNFHSLMSKKASSAKRLQNYEILLGILLIAAYSFVFTLSIRSLRHSAPPLRIVSMACVAVLPIRMALGALDLAQSRQLSRAIELFIFSSLHHMSGIPEKDAQILAHWGSLASSVTQVAWTFGVCIFFFYASRYFQRPDVLASSRQISS